MAGEGAEVEGLPRRSRCCSVSGTEAWHTARITGDQTMFGLDLVSTPGGSDRLSMGQRSGRALGRDRVAGGSCHRERATGIEPAFSAWEAARAGRWRTTTTRYGWSEGMSRLRRTALHGSVRGMAAGSPRDERAYRPTAAGCVLKAGPIIPLTCSVNLCKMCVLGRSRRSQNGKSS